MEAEQQPSPLRHIHVDLENWSVILEGADGRAISFNPRDLLAQLTASLSSAEAPTLEAPATVERDPTVTLAGRLKSVPKEGRPDGSGNPTAFARFAAHEDGSSQARMYLATFHRKSREIALGLKPDSPIIVEGYPHPATEPGKSDTLSVVHIIDYPGKHKSQRNAD